MNFFTRSLGNDDEPAVFTELKYRAFPLSPVIPVYLINKLLQNALKLLVQTYLKLEALIYND